VYAYSGCGTCRKALAWLATHGIDVVLKPIRDEPPSKADLAKAHAQIRSLRALFNTSGGDYKELGLKDKIAAMKDDDAIALLASRGNLVKRPFIVLPKGYLVGFDEAAYAKTFRQS
jgi:arsenate reductase (glutaredoxin)